MSNIEVCLFVGKHRKQILLSKYKLLLCLNFKDLFLFQVYVYSTENTYTQGEFVANLFLQGNSSSRDAKMAGFIKTCENRAKIVGKCDYMTNFDIDEFDWPEDSSAPQILNYKGDPRFI